MRKSCSDMNGVALIDTICERDNMHAAVQETDGTC